MELDQGNVDRTMENRMVKKTILQCVIQQRGKGIRQRIKIISQSTIKLLVEKFGYFKSVPTHQDKVKFKPKVINWEILPSVV